MGDAATEYIGDFRILGKLKGNAGSQGAVLKAVCESPSWGLVAKGQVVALKVMMDSGGDKAKWRRLEARTRALAALEHPNIVQYLGCFWVQAQFGEMHVVVQEYLEGETLKERLARNRGGLDADEAVKIVLSAAEGLRHASINGIVHRDVKPANIFICLDSDGKISAVKMIDFEIARMEQEEGTLSTSGSVHGTFDYVAPEFMDPEFQGDAASDVFSLGVVLHEALTGRLPYKRVAEIGGRAEVAFYSRWFGHAEGSRESAVCVDGGVKHILLNSEMVFRRSLTRNRTKRYGDFSGFIADLSAASPREVVNGERSYALLKFIGKGGFGEVYKARDNQTGGLVAIKHLLNEEYFSRFDLEGKVMRRLYDPDGRFVRFVDFFKIGQIVGSDAFLVMDFLEGMPGCSLRDAIRMSMRSRRSGMSRDEVLRAFVRYAHGLARMHAMGFVHRDIKPSNLYYPVGHPERSAIMDLGVVRDLNGTITQGGVPGTLDYMPPEVVVTKARGDSKMDLYALGLCLYEALTGKPGYSPLPRGMTGLPALIERSRTLVPPVFNDPVVVNDGELRALLVEMTEPDVRRRIGDALAVAERLERMIAMGPRPLPQPPPQRPVPRPVVRPVAPNPRPQPQPRQRSGSSHSSGVRRQPCAVLPVTPYRRPLFPELSRILSALGTATALYAATACVIAAVLYFCGPALKVRMASWQMKKVLAEYAATETADERTVLPAEITWRASWNPNSSSWVTLDAKTYESMSLSLEGGKREAVQRRKAEALARQRAKEREEWLGLLSRSLRPGGGLDEAGYVDLDGKTMPTWLAENGDVDVLTRQRMVASALRSAIMTKLEVEPVATRRQRRDAAGRLFAVSWTKRLLGSEECALIEAAFSKWSRTKVIVVDNACAADAITVGGRVIPAGGSSLFVFKDGLPSEFTASRVGYETVELKAKSAEEKVVVKDSDFTAKPLKVEFPVFERGVRCVLGGGREVKSGESVKLSPGDYECVYSRDDTYVDLDGVSRMIYEVQTNSFSVSVGALTVVPAPLSKHVWPMTKGFVKQKASASSPSMLPSSDSEDDSMRPSYVGAATFGRGDLAREVIARCGRLLALEPVDTRQERLKQAEIILTSAEGVDRIVTAEEARPMSAAIAERKKWEVGWVANKCADSVFVAGKEVPGGESRLLVFKDGLPERWTVTRSGYEEKALKRDFDGREISIRDEDFVPLAIEMKIPVLEDGVTCFFEAKPVMTDSLSLRPGFYHVVYRRAGYADQVRTFEVTSGGSRQIPSPVEWRRTEQR